MNPKNGYPFKFVFMILNFFVLSTSAQTPGNNYDPNWKKVRAFEDKGLTNSAIGEVNTIYNLAKKENNEPQIIKSLLYKNKLSQNITEDATKKMIDTMEQEILVSPQPAKSILQNITAQLYQNYFAYNRYRLYSISDTEGFLKDDIATWSVADFKNKISFLYEASLQNKELQKISLEPFDAIIEKGNARYLRPTLFDLLAHRALNYFKSTENDINRPAYSFEIDNERSFSPAREFIKENFESSDTSSLQLKALRLFQELIALHIHDTGSLIDVDLERLDFVKQFAVLTDKEQLYMDAMKHIYQAYSSEESAMAGYRWAQQLYQLAQAKENKDATKISEAVAIYNDIIKNYPNSEAATYSFNSLEEIKHPTLSVMTEKVNVVNKPLRALVSYTNINRIYLRVIPVTKKQKEDIRDVKTLAAGFEKMRTLKFLKEWKQDLPETKDFIRHHTEIKVDNLPVGEYILMAGTDKNFSTGNNLLTANYLFVSNISFVNNGRNFFVLDRESGQPVPEANVRIMRRTYNYNLRKYVLNHEADAKTDSRGFFRIPPAIPDNFYNIRVDISTPQDRLYLDDDQPVYTYNPFVNDYNYKSQDEVDKAKATVYFFTDRSIYRPGQIVYYKGIGVTQGSSDRKPRPLKTGTSIRIFLFDANGQKVDSTNVSLNDYGSFNGRFLLPQNQLTGTYRISAQEYPRGNAMFSVEEYKRPKFFAEFAKAGDTYKVNDTVRITGKAEAYAGNRVDGAQVSYRVVRIARFLYPWRFWKTGLPNISPLEITHGETITDENGQFLISFKAIPDRQIDPETEPVFDYKISADITDINGETRSTEITVPVGYKALDLRIGIADKTTFIADHFKEINITARNLSGEPQDVLSEIKLYQLKAPGRLLRERFWQMPDTFVMSKDEYTGYFPHDIYKDEDMPETWEKTKLIIDREDSVSGNLRFTPDKVPGSGWYMMEALAYDKYGNEVKDVKYFRILNAKEKKLNTPDYYVFVKEDKDYEPGNTASMYLATVSNINLIQYRESDKPRDTGATPDFRYYPINNQVKNFSFHINDNDLGGFGIQNFFVRDNRLYYTKSTVNVPWNNKKLDITFDTYREKTLPGSEETWKVKVTGYKGEKIAAEMLAGMYDASLDQFRPHSWNKMNLWPSYYSYGNWQGNQNFSSAGSLDLSFSPPNKNFKEKIYDKIIPIDDIYTMSYYGGAAPVMMKRENVQVANLQEADVATVAFIPPSVSLDEVTTSSASENDKTLAEENITVRTNFNETAFFYPGLETDDEGNIIFSFTMPEALTTWKLMALAHSKDLATGYTEKSVITQKDLMIVPNVPRFMREGDQMEFSAKVVNMSDKELIVSTEFHLLNATTMLPVDQWFKNTDTTKTIAVPANGSKPVFFSIDIPKGFNDMVVYRIIARTGPISDGEEAFIPVVTNRMMVTEALPLEMKGTGTKIFSFNKLLKSGARSTLTNHGLTIEYTPDPAWYALQALPYLNSYPYECTEQVFNRYFANALAMNIANSSPKLKAVFEKWKDQDTSALLSNLQKNQELKSVLLEETPWVMQAKNEEQQKKNIALLFDIVNMTNQLDGALKTVKERQSSNGGFVWMKGGPDDRYMTQYIVADIGHLKKLGAWPEKNSTDLNNMARKAIAYLDNRITEDYQKLKNPKGKPDDNNLSYLIVHYLYTRSFFNDIPVGTQAKEAYSYYLNQGKKFWLKQSIYGQGLLALALHRSGDTKTAMDIVRSLKENAITSETSGMYWKAWDVRGWWWYQAPIESQSLMIEVFSEVAEDSKAVTELKTWLLKNKQTNNWKTTRATAEAVYALLLQGTDWLSQDKQVQIKLGSTIFDHKNEKQETGTGYFKRIIDGAGVRPEMGNISVTVTQPGVKTENVSPSWGAVYWQYFEDLDKITFAETPLKLSKKLFVEKNTDRGPVLIPVNDGDQLRIGDKIKVRIELHVDRDMEYVHMKDMRASSMEPVNVLSQYKRQGGLGYYESTKDASTNFFFSYLLKGTYVFEYPLFISHSGNFSNGITTIQSMYAPEFTAHSEGIRINVK